MEDKIENYFLSLPEPEQSVLLFLHLFFSKEVMLSHKRKFNTPFYYYNGKWFCYLDYNKVTRSIHVSFVKGNQVSHPKLLSEGRKQMKIYRVNLEKDINVKELAEIITLLKKRY